MVTFTCNNCGDSIKKVRVEKHYSVECRKKSGGPNLCCIDCLKDFGQNYEEHTSCKSEDERYAAKGTYVPGDPKNKQAKKQMTWSEIIQTTSKLPNLDRSSKDILDIIKESDNVPRKMGKFKNFCKNNFHLRRFTEGELTLVFNLIQNELKKDLEAVSAEKQKQLSNKENTQQESGKKRALDEEDGRQSKKVKANEIDIDMEEPQQKKKNAVVMETSDVSENIKKKKKSEEVKENSTNEEIVDASLTNGKSKKKKKKSKSKNVENPDVVQAVVDDSLTNREKKKNEKSVSEDQPMKNISLTKNDISQNNTDTNSNSINKSPKKKKKSEEPDRNQFKDTVIKLLKPGTEFKLKSLKKMVFAVYKTGEQEVPKEVRENFTKKLLKIPNVTINEKIVKMVK